MASALVRRAGVLQHFRDGVHWLTLGPSPPIPTLLNQLFRELGISSTVVDTADGWYLVVSVLVSKDFAGKAKLEEVFQADVQCILVLSDVWQLSHARPFLALNNKCAVIVTTKKTKLWPEVAYVLSLNYVPC